MSEAISQNKEPNKPEPFILSAENFIKALKGETVELENGEPKKFLYKKFKHTFRDQEYELEDWVVIWNVEVNEKILIEEKNTFEYPILILSGEFNDEFSISGGEFNKKFRIEGGEFNDEFRIEGGEFNESFSIDGDATFNREFRIEGGEFNSEFSIEGGEFKDGFSISGGEFKDGFSISGGEFNDGFRIYGGEFKSWFRISGGEFKNEFRIEGGVKFGSFWIYGGKFNEAFWIYGGEFKYGFSIYGGEFKDEFGISDGAFKSLFSISGGEFKDEFRIEGGEFNEAFWIYGGEFNKVHISPKSISRLIYSDSIVSQVVINLETASKNAIIEQITFRNVIQGDGRLYLEEATNLKNLTFKKFKNWGKIDLSNIKSPKGEKGCLEIITSNFGEAYFQDVDFSSFEEIIIDNSKLNTISTVTGHLPTKGIYTGENNNSDSKKLAELYNQLYLAMQKQGNRKQEMDYYAQYLYWQQKAVWDERAKYYEELKDKPSFKKLHKFGKEAGQAFDLGAIWFALGHFCSLLLILAEQITKPIQPFMSPSLISLWFNKITTNYGRSWIQGVVGTLLIAIPFYLIYVSNLDKIACPNGVKSPTWDIGFYIKNYLRFLLPTHPFDLISCYSANAFATLADILSRIFVGFWIYQTIAAFRRYGRK